MANVLRDTLKEVTITGGEIGCGGDPDVVVVDDVKGGGVRTRDDRRSTRRHLQESLKRPKCEYLRGGVCKEHGGGAIKKWKPTKTTVVGEDGLETVRRGRKEFYACNLSIKNLKTTPVDKDNPSDRDTVSEEESFCDSASQCVGFSTLSVGQPTDCARAWEMTMENLVDEKNSATTW